MGETVGVDLGGSHVLATIVDDDGRIVDRAEHEITDHTVDVAVGIIAQAIDEVLHSARGDVTAIGLGRRSSRWAAASPARATSCSRPFDPKWTS
jgi:predicted NBD/HSP70 family sugar kinase